MTRFACFSLPIVLALAPHVAGAAPPTAFDEAVRTLQEQAPHAKFSRSAQTGLVTFVSAEPGTTLSPVALPGDTPEERAIAFVGRHAALFGLTDASAELRVDSTNGDALGMTHVRFAQLHQGVPITGGEMIVHLKGDRAMSVTARTLVPAGKIRVIPSLSPAAAADVARAALRKYLGVEDATIGEPRLEVFNKGVLDSRTHPTRLAWFMEATRIDLREFVWVDAESGRVLLHFSQRPSALSRSIYNGASGATLPGTLIRSEGGPVTGDADADAAYKYSGDTYNYFFTQFGRDSFDGAGGAILSTVHHCPSPAQCPYPNAFWNGTQMVYGDGFSLADDVDAHELTHAVTERTARLFYYMQSGALNESYSDIFGETVDQGNGAGNDTPGARWLLGEDVPGGAARNMMDPTAFGDPGKLTDGQFVCQDPGGDAGGVHSNSGVPNHAYALMVDGGTYNAITVAGIGSTKAAQVQYRALTHYLLSASDFIDNYLALKQSCSDLVGTAGITSANCLEVAKALDAVVMGDNWPCTPTQPGVPNLCPGGGLPSYVMNENFDEGLSTGYANWATTTLAGRLLWFSDNSNATSGTYDLFGLDDFDGTPDYSRAYTINPVVLPANARMQFNHSYGFENSGTTAYDGGRVVISVNGGAFASADGFISTGATYNGVLNNMFGNPLGGMSAFVRDSWGYTATQLDLSSLAGQSVRIGFEIGTDNGFDDYGWFIDDVRIYTCGPAPTMSISDGARVEGNAGTANMVFTVTLSAPSPNVVSVAYSTAPVSAASGTDYLAQTGSLTFLPGVTSLTIAVPVVGDSSLESNETFNVNLVGAENATLADGTGVGTIIDDDATIPEPAPVYRLLQSQIGAYLFTVYPFERDSAQLQYGYIYEGVCCKWFTLNAGDGRTPLFRLFSASAGEYFFTIYASERDSAVTNYGYIYEGVSAYCHPTPTGAAPNPWYRLRHGNKHIYTIYASERDSAVTNYGYTYEGISCYLPPP